jgi:hypothetical protein
MIFLLPVSVIGTLAVSHIAGGRDIPDAAADQSRGLASLSGTISADQGVRARGLITLRSPRKVKPVLVQTSWSDVLIPLAPISHSGWRHPWQDRRLFPANGPCPSDN